MKKKTEKPKRNKQSKKEKDNNKKKKVNKAIRKKISENKNDSGANYENAFWSPY